MQVGPIGTNCYILEDDKTNKAAVIDPGDEADKIAQVLQKDGAEVEYILLTHGHYDHTTGVPDLKKRFPDAQVYIHQADANGAGSTLYPLAGQVAGLKHYKEGDSLTLGSLTIQVMETPGHSPGSVTLRVGDVLFTGDTLFCGSCGRTDLRGGSYEQIMASLKRLGELEGGSYEQIMASLKRLGELEGDFHVCPGHDRTSTLEQERRYNPFLMEAMRG